MNSWLLFVAFIVLGAAWTAVWGWAVWRSRGSTAPYEPVLARGSAFRARLFLLTVAVLIVAFFVSIRWFPYRGLAEARLGRPTVHVAVAAKMWQWTLSQADIPSGTPVEFAVTSQDVNHGFGIYGPSGRLIAQVQAMPGYTNHLVVAFSQPGTYLVRCLEFCGIPHIGMVTAFEVK